MNQPTALGKYAVITAASPNLWVDLVMLLHSFRIYCHHDIYVVSLGLSEDQKIILEQQYSAKIIDFNDDITYKFDNNWPKWCKPFYFDLLPKDIDYILWIDADAVITNSLGPLFAKATENFFVLSDYFAPATCYNNPELYHKYQIQYSDVVLNSGVIGLSLQREEDKAIIDEWQSLTRTIDGDMLPHVTLYDQGMLLLAMHKLQKTHLILSIKEWNYPAKRNPYNFHENSYRWPINASQTGGDLLCNIKNDNPTAIICHFAGMPKLSNLLNVDDKSTIENFRNRRGIVKQKRVFIVGLERAGTHTLAEAISHSVKIESWIRHEYLEQGKSHLGALAAEAYHKFHQHAYPLENLYRRLFIYARTDCGIVCEANHRLSFFIPEIKKGLNGNCKFILVLRDPISLMRSRLYNFSTWVSALPKHAGSYQHDLHAVASHNFSPWLSEFNLFRITPPEDLDIVCMHIWEICTTLEVIFSDVKKSGVHLATLWLEQFSTSGKIVSDMFRPYIDQDVFQQHLNVRYGVRHNTPSVETVKWIEDLLVRNNQRIVSSIYSILVKHGQNIPFV